MSIQPLVSVVTPAYNAGKFLRECIESVRAQSYSSWEHVILDNASTDDTRLVAERCARSDPRIKVFANPATVPFVENWNRSLARMSPLSRYCRVLHADDWIYPACLERMVDLAENHPDAGIVSSLRLRGGVVECLG